MAHGAPGEPGADASAHWATRISDEWLGDEVLTRLKLSESRYQALAKLDADNKQLLAALKSALPFVGVTMNEREDGIGKQAKRAYAEIVTAIEAAEPLLDDAALTRLLRDVRDES